VGLQIEVESNFVTALLVEAMGGVLNLSYTAPDAAPDAAAVEYRLGYDPLLVIEACAPGSEADGGGQNGTAADAYEALTFSLLNNVPTTWTYSDLMALKAEVRRALLDRTAFTDADIRAIALDYTGELVVMANHGLADGEYTITDAGRAAGLVSTERRARLRSRRTDTTSVIVTVIFTGSNEAAATAAAYMALTTAGVVRVVVGGVSYTVSSYGMTRSDAATIAATTATTAATTTTATTAEPTTAEPTGGAASDNDDFFEAASQSATRKTGLVVGIVVTLLLVVAIAFVIGYKKGKLNAVVSPATQEEWNKLNIDAPTTSHMDMPFLPGSAPMAGPGKIISTFNGRAGAMAPIPVARHSVAAQQSSSLAAPQAPPTVLPGIVNYGKEAVV
jgi:hypothetical protein